MDENSKDIKSWNCFLAGDKMAFVQLFESHYSFLFLYGIKVYHNRQTIEDCIQELFLDLWKNKPPPPHRSVKLYLAKALQYKLFKIIKKEQSQNQSSFIHNDFEFELSFETLFIEKQNSNEKTSVLIECFSKLSNRQREIIYLRFIKNMEYQQISEVMQLSYQAARNLVSKSLQLLKKAVNERLYF